jgi:hypothetical protein
LACCCLVFFDSCRCTQICTQSPLQINAQFATLLDEKKKPGDNKVVYGK